MAVWTKNKAYHHHHRYHLGSGENHIINLWTSGFFVVRGGFNTAVQHMSYSAVYLPPGCLFLD